MKITDKRLKGKTINCKFFKLGSEGSRYITCFTYDIDKDKCFITLETTFKGKTEKETIADEDIPFYVNNYAGLEKEWASFKTDAIRLVESGVLGGS